MAPREQSEKAVKNNWLVGMDQGIGWDENLMTLAELNDFDWWLTAVGFPVDCRCTTMLWRRHPTQFGWSGVFWFPVRWLRFFRFPLSLVLWIYNSGIKSEGYHHLSLIKNLLPVYLQHLQPNIQIVVGFDSVH